MSKITAKNLSYSRAPPPFLAAFQAQASGQAEPADPFISGRKRNAKKRSASEEAEDEPLIVDEDGNVVTLNGDDEKGATEEKPTAEEDGEGVKPKAEEEGKRSVIGGRRKKVGRVVGPSDEKEKDERDDAKKGEGDGGSRKLPRDGDAKTAAPKRGIKKKGKKIKLSFDDEDEGGV